MPEDEERPSISGLGVCVLECPTELSRDQVTAAVAAHAPDLEIIAVDGRATWRRIEVWVDAAMLGPIAVIERASKPGKLPVYARLWLSAGPEDMTDDDVRAATTTLAAITADLAHRHGVVLIDFEPGPELRKGSVDIPDDGT